MAKRVTEAEIQESIRFADGGSAAAGHFVTRPEASADVVQALRSQITFDEAVDRAAERAKATELLLIQEEILAGFGPDGPTEGGPSLREDREADDSSLDKRIKE